MVGEGVVEAVSWHHVFTIVHQMKSFLGEDF